MSILKLIIAPLLGGVIGYITNDLALKMLFHPHKAIYIGKWHVPFTPGLIPSQKGRLAKSLGQVVSGQLLDSDTIRREALSDEAQDKLRRTIRESLEKQADDPRSLRKKLSTVVPPEKLSGYEREAIERGGVLLINQILQAHVGETIAAYTINALRNKLADMPFVGGNLMNMVALNAGVITAVEQTVAKNINRLIAEKGPVLMNEKLTALGDDMMGRPFSEVVGAYRENIPALTERMLELYRNLLSNNLESILSAARIDKIVEHKIESFSAAELEDMIFSIMKRELRAIVYLGAALGFLMGFINLLF